jgi:HEAT repeat protein
MKQHFLRLFVYCFGMVLAIGSKASEPDVFTTFQEARQLERDGQTHEAFLKYLTIPGGEFAAFSLAQGNAGEFLQVLHNSSNSPASFRTSLVEADLLLATGQSEAARQRYHLLAIGAGVSNWGTEQPGYYPVEPPQTGDASYPFDVVQRNGPALPFSIGPGSHRDNWLLRRLIALDLTNDAAQEFSRLWEVHRTNTQPFAVIIPSMDRQGREAGEEKKLARPPGFNSFGLQFALDYAYFLKRSGQTNAALDLLLEPLRVMDLDRNPNLVHLESLPPELAALPVKQPIAPRRFGYGSGSSGVSRKEFIRLAYGEFKTAGLENALQEALQKQIATGENRARRVLAQVRLHQGQRDAALALELEYLQNCSLDPLSAACRRGQIHEEYQQAELAIAAYEKAQAMAIGPVQMPDAEEQIPEASYLQQQAIFPSQSVLLAGDGISLDTLHLPDRLQRLYGALGRNDKVLEIELAQADAVKGSLDSMAELDQIARRFSAAGQNQRFADWARQTFSTSKLPRARANLAWQLQWTNAAVTNAAIAAATDDYGSLREEWRNRFAKTGGDLERQFLRAVLEANPTNAMARLGLLESEPQLEGAGVVSALEALLAPDAADVFATGKGVWNRSRFKGYPELAYRLMRLYERAGRMEDLRALGLRLAKGEKPFEQLESTQNYPGGENGAEDFCLACLSLAIEHADNPAYRDQLAAALKTSHWAGARAQLARRMDIPSGATAAKQPSSAGALRGVWANLPSGVRVVASTESVTCQARDEHYIYTGQPWGVAVYSLEGSPVTRILLNREVTCLLVAPPHLWVGTHDGLFRIEPGQWVPARAALGSVSALAREGDQIWIGTRNGVSVLNRNTLSLRTFTSEELGLKRSSGTLRFAVEGGLVWADNEQEGLLKYDRAGDVWSKPVSIPGTRDPAHLIDLIDGQVWADVYLNNELRHRPALVDKRTMRITPAQLGGNLPRDRRLWNEPVTCLGKVNGQLVFRSVWGSYLYDAASNTLRPRPESGEMTNATVIPAHPPEAPAPRGVWPDGLRAGVVSTAWADSWPRDAVWAVLFDDAHRQAWLCTGDGLAILPEESDELKHLGVAEGACLGPVLDGAELGGKYYFTSGWDDARGGLLVYDPGTGVFTPFSRVDGLDSDKVIGLQTVEGKLELRFGVEYRRYQNDNNNLRYRHCPPGLFDPVTGRFTSGGGPELLGNGNPGMHLTNSAFSSLPLLGGPAWRSYEHERQHWVCGSLGLVVFAGATAPALNFSTLNVVPEPNLTVELRAQAASLSLQRPISIAALKRLTAHTNQYVRANALAAAMGPVMNGENDYVPVITNCISDSFMPARATAVALLAESKSAAAIPALRLALGDADPYIRAVAALRLADLGEVPSLDYFEEIIERNYDYGNFPFGADSSLGVKADAVMVFATLAPHADRDIFAFLVKKTPPNHDDIKKLYPVLGASLRRHPEASDVLLAVQDGESWAPLRNFVQGVFQQAGVSMLPRLHHALASPDRVVRSNAARACGAIGDQSSIAPLIQALDLESGLSRASIVWALGQLKAREALPRLAELYTDARNAEKNRRAAGGFLAQQAAASNRAEYTALRNLNAIASDWDELKAAARPRTHNPRRDEELLTAAQVLEAVREIGPEFSQPFYRALAGAVDADDRMQAAIGLGSAAGSDWQPSLAILKTTKGDANPPVRIAAEVSLLQLGLEDGRAGLLADLKNEENPERGRILEQLARLPAARLEPFRDVVQHIVTNQQEPEYLRNRAAGLIRALP